MFVPSRRLAFVIVLAVGLAGAAGWAAGGVSLLGQGWQIVTEEGKQRAEVRALVVNGGRSPLSYEVRFLAESRESPLAGRAEAEGQASGKVVEPSWTVLATTSMRGDGLAPGQSAPVKGLVPYYPPAAGKEYRYRAELVDRSTNLVVAAAVMTQLAAPAVTALGVAGVIGVAGAVGVAAAALGGGGGGDESPSTASGAGTMEGEHEAQRVGDAWVEHGSGTISVETTLGQMILDYQYDSSGASAAELNATATATGELTTPGGPVLAVVISSATARMVVPGEREQTGSLIRRSGSVATGTFTGTVGGARWSGLLTLTGGEQTLDLDSGTGAHQFSIRFTASR